MVSSSGSSLLVTRIAISFPAEPIHQPVEFRLGTDIDTACRVVQQQHLRLRQQPAADDRLLLVAADRLVMGASRPLVFTAS